MTTIRRLKALKSVGILADRTAREADPIFRRFNLVYGFNGSGKSTLSRLFACLEAGKLDDSLPDGCSFEIEFDDGSVLAAPDALIGAENRICVFNEDFITRNLRWQEGRAASIFYISEEQADLAADLKATQDALSKRRDLQSADRGILREREKALKGYRTERARLIAGSLHLGNRRYEAGQLQADYERVPYDTGSLLEVDALDALIDVARLSEPPPPLKEISIDVAGVLRAAEIARDFAELSVGQVVLDEIEKHPSMLPWINAGHDYHSARDLDSCLFCGSELTESRKKKLAEALDDKISKLLSDLQKANAEVSALIHAIGPGAMAWPRVAEIDLQLQAPYGASQSKLEEVLVSVLSVLKEVLRVIEARLKQPTTPVNHDLPSSATVKECCDTLNEAILAANDLIRQHNKASADFMKRQREAREAIKKHYLAEGHDTYEGFKKAVAEAEAAVNASDDVIADLLLKIADLSGKVRSHGPAADKITRLVRAYLGHGELTIFAAEEGYELHRHGKIVKGPPSEGERTAIALCYFLSTLESDGRVVKDLIVVIDDPISSLDTKAMNYACTLIRSRLADVAQLFILTHNQHCMNEFKKAWRNNAAGTPPTATLLYMDVTIAEGSGGVRTARIVDLPAHLRGYDSEYHFLCHKMLQFEAAGTGHSEYWFMMPNVIRRILEIFLAFKVPGSHPLQQKLETLAKKHTEVDDVRIKALERLIQVESHSDSLEDLISHSSMTVEETRDANAALLALMAASDADHTAAIRKQCKAT
ncbi:AAA family ATPase [Sinorhizobium meliloti]|uniref:AAA family ATPase n=1 Tax=Rhizobium meliloti TaxID=382 RepID=UPI000FDBD4EC|nr:AAA family ATPase [Sinorhizobium meliloti]RVK13470.1 hypothetical protein CN164_10265 [Sinorhizobium meliloti]